MQRIKVGALSYTNALPFFYPLFSGKIHHNAELIFGTPSHLNHLLIEGAVDVAMVSSLSFIDHRRKSVLISDVGIASTEAVTSVCFFAPIDIDPNSFDTIFITKESETSVRLLKVLCHHFWKIFPKFEPYSGSAKELIASKKPFLSIGDSCLELLEIPDFKIIDLAQAWHLATSKSFIFALLATNNTSLQQHNQEIFEFHRAIDRAFHWSQKNLDEIIDYAHRHLKNVSKKTLHTYYTSDLEYQLSSRHFQGLEYFAELEQSAPELSNSGGIV